VRIINKDVSIIKHIVNGNVEINSADEFKKTLQMFPESAELHKSFGDLLVGKKIFLGAANAYKKAAELFFAEGKPLQAISATLHEWKLAAPKLKDYRALYVALKRCKIAALANVLADCLLKMSYEESFAIISNLEIISMPPKTLVKKAGDEEDGFYFVISGELTDSLSPPAKVEAKHNEPVGHLAENYFFGDVYPFEEKRRSTSISRPPLRLSF